MMGLYRLFFLWECSSFKWSANHWLYVCDVLTYIFSPCFEAPVKSVLQPQDMLRSRWSTYLFQHYISDGVFSRLARCKDQSTKGAVAMKILKKRINDSQEPIREVNYLSLFNSLSSTFHLISNINL